MRRRSERLRAALNERHRAPLAHLPTPLDRVDRVASRLGVNDALTQADVENTTAYVGDGYGTVSDAATDAISLLARSEGIVLDPIYSGKAFAGLIDQVRNGPVESGERVVFVHTGALPGLFAHADRLAYPRARTATPTRDA